jgi:hypothetical protein
MMILDFGDEIFDHFNDIRTESHFITYCTHTNFVKLIIPKQLLI